MPERPNVLLVQADQHRYDCVGASGHPLVETPTLDGLAADGARFSRAYTPIPICSPERASLLTGRWPCEHDVLNLVGQPGGGTLDTDAETFATLASRAGYDTRYVGRWHLGRSDAGGPENHGFDGWIPPGRYAEWRARAGLPERPTPGEVGWHGGVDPVDPDESRLAWGADRTIEQLEALADAEPFLLRWDTFEPHLPNVVPEPYASMYDPDDVEPWPGFDDDLSDKPWIQRQQLRTWRLEGADWADWAPTVARYLGEISLLDAQFGRVLDALDRLGLAEDTVVIYTADHGDMCGSHGMIDKHYVMYEDVTRVPLFVRWPGVAEPGTVVDSFVTHALDVAATISEAATGTVPDGTGGESLRGLLTGEREGREDIYVTYYGSQMGLYTQRMVRDDRHKYVWNATAPDELYDLERDPGETTNRIDDSDYAAIRERLQGRLLAWLRETGDQLDNPWTAGQLDDDAWPPAWDPPWADGKSRDDD